MALTSLAEQAAYLQPPPDDAADDAARHPHRPAASLPVTLPVATLRELSRVSAGRALAAVATEWLIIGGAIAAGVLAHRALVTALAIVVIGARQHALTVLGHDGAHFRLFPGKRMNDWLGELLIGWPVFVSVRQFRVAHGPHHRFLGEPGDGNRRAWRTHGDDGGLLPEWRYPKTRLGIALVVLRRAAVFTGLFWVLRSLVAPFVLRISAKEIVARFAYYAAIVGALVATGHGLELVLFWFVPLCTWHIAAQYIRLICEHSGRIGAHPDFARTRSTLPGPLARFFVLPRNIGYHLEHHWYPSVPFYRLPQLHAALAADPLFAREANVSRSILKSLGECVGEATA